MLINTRNDYGISFVWIFQKKCIVACPSTPPPPKNKFMRCHSFFFVGNCRNNRSLILTLSRDIIIFDASLYERNFSFSIIASSNKYRRERERELKNKNKTSSGIKSTSDQDLPSLQLLVSHSNIMTKFRTCRVKRRFLIPDFAHLSFRVLRQDENPSFLIL